MDWLDNLQKAINYIEEHLLEDEMITDMNISHEIYSSTDSFRTIFRVVTGYSVGEYIRNRRLSLSGEELIQSGHTILDIALKYGYDTPEGFTKAFSRFHGVTPSYVRKNRTGLRTFTRVQLKIQAVGGSKLDYFVEKLEDLCIVGYEREFSDNGLEDNNIKIPEFIRQCCITDFDGMGHFAEKGKFENAMLGYRYNEGQQLHYIFGVVGSEDIIDVPSPYSIKKILSKNWVCFPCEAGVDAIQKLWYRIYTEFMPFSSYKINENETLEISFCKNRENQLYLYMPIKEDV